MKHLILLRLSALGDLIHCLPLYYSLIHNYPKSTIHWVVDKNFVDLIVNLPNIKIHKVDKTNLKTLICSSIKIRKTLKKYPIKAIINCHDSMNANLVSLFLPKPTHKNKHIGLAKSQARDLQTLFVSQSAENQNNENQHAVMQYLNLAQTLGIKAIQCFDLNRKKKRDEKKNQRIVLINLSTSDAHLARAINWSIYEIIIEQLIENTAKKVDTNLNYLLILAGQKNNNTLKLSYHLQALFQEKLNQLQQNTQKVKLKNTVSQLNLKNWLDLIQSSSLIISPDSAAVHLADAFKIPCLSLYFATNPKKIGQFQNQEFCLDYYQKARKKYLNKNDAWDQKIYQKNLSKLIHKKELIKTLDQAFERSC